MRKAVGSWLALGSLGLLAACDAPSPTDAGLDADLDGGVDVAAPVDTSDGDAGGPPPGFRISLSPSPYVEPIFAAGVRFEDGATVARTGAELAGLFVDHGATEIFTRISTERAEVGRAGHHALATGLLRAADAAALDLPLNPEISLFGSYGDVSCQTAPSFTEYPELTVPGPWETLTIAQMVPVVRAYAALVAEALLATGARIEPGGQRRRPEQRTRQLTRMPRQHGAQAPAHPIVVGLERAPAGQLVGVGLGVLAIVVLSFDTKPAQSSPAATSSESASEGPKG